MIRPTRFEVACDAYDCEPERFRPMSRPLVLEASCVREASKSARAAGWSPAPGRGSWWCPRHADVANRRRTELAAKRAVTV